MKHLRQATLQLQLVAKQFGLLSRGTLVDVERSFFLRLHRLILLLLCSCLLDDILFMYLLVISLSRIKNLTFGVGATNT